MNRKRLAKNLIMGLLIAISTMSINAPPVHTEGNTMETLNQTSA